jgi:hypothetical protein
MLLGLSLLAGCTFLHHAQIGDIDNSAGYRQVPFDIKLSETGVSLDDVKKVAEALGSREGQAGAEYLGYIQMGPRTGNPVYVERYAEELVQRIHSACPTGKVTGLVSIRESNKYPIISGEIVKVTGYCLKKR